MSELVSQTKVLFVFEGNEPESQIFTSLSQNFFADSRHNHIKAIFGQDIYELYRLLKADDGYRDLLDIIKEKSPDKEALAGVLRNHISDIYLIFDYDGHVANFDSSLRANDDHLKEMLSYFKEPEKDDEEFDRDNVKLYLSYPMVEAIKHLKTGVHFSETIVDAKENINYKNLASENCEHIFNQIKKWDANHWTTIIHAHCNKLNFVMTDDFTFPQQTFNQLEVFEAQLIKYITQFKKVAVLSAFPVLLLDYYGIKKLQEKIAQPTSSNNSPNNQLSEMN